MVEIQGPFRASEAVPEGRVTRGVLAGPTTTRLYPNVHVAADGAAAAADLAGRAREAVLYVRGDPPVVAGHAAAHLLGASCGPLDAAVDLAVGRRRVRPRDGLTIRQDVIAPDDVVVVDGLRVTSYERTAWDLVRRLDAVEGVVALDALSRVGGFAPAAVLARPAGVRGSTRVAAAVAASDPRAESPPETRVRLLLASHGVAAPTPQVVVVDAGGAFVGRVDLGWERARVAVEYQGDHHRTDRDRWRRDQARLAGLAAVGWLVLPCTADDLRHPGPFIRRVLSALAARCHDQGHVTPGT
jgi:hypothetical protein